MSQKHTEHQQEQQAHGERAMQHDAQQSQQKEQQQQQSSPGVDKMKATWKQQIGAAKITWEKLTDDELLKSEGHADKLAGLVQERYAISREAASNQVKQFIEKCKCA